MGHLYDSDAGVLLMVGAESAVERAAIANLCRELKRDPARTVVLGCAHVHLGVGAYDALEASVLGTPFLHVDASVSDVDLGVEDPVAYGADATGQFYEDRVPSANLCF